MWCLRARRLISAFHDQELDLEAAQQVAAHVKCCSRCFRELQRVKRGAELASVYRPAGSSDGLACQVSLPTETCIFSGHSRTQLRLFLAASVAALVLAAGVLLRSPLHNLLWRPASGEGCVLDLGGGSRDARADALEAFRVRYSGRFHEVPFEGEPGRDWVGFDYKFPSRVPPRMRLKSVMLFDPACCGGLGLVFADGRRNLCLLQQPSDRPMSVSGLAMDREQIGRFAASGGIVGSYSIHTWTADNLQYVLLSDLPHDEIEATVASLRYVR